MTVEPGRAFGQRIGRPPTGSPAPAPRTQDEPPDVPPMPVSDYVGKWRGDELADVRPGFWHNVVAHPLLVLCPPVGDWLHGRTSPTVPTWSARLDRWVERLPPWAG